MCPHIGLFLVLLLCCGSSDASEVQCYGEIAEYRLVDDAEVVVSAHFRDFVDTDYFGLFEVKRRYKGDEVDRRIAVSLEGTSPHELSTLRPGAHFILLLRLPKDTDLSVRTRFALSTASKLSLYIPMKMARLSTWNETARKRAEVFKWLAELLLLSGETRRRRLQDGIRSDNPSIVSNARQILAKGVRKKVESFAQPPVSLPSPSDRGIAVSNPPELHWPEAGRVMRYHLQVGHLPDFSSILVNDSTLHRNEYSSLPWLSLGIYYWRVRARRPGRPWSEWSATWSFSVKVGVVGTTTDCFGQDCATGGSFVFVASTGGGCRIVDVSDVENPRVTRRRAVPGGPYRIHWHDGFVYTIVNGSGRNDALSIVDARDPLNPSTMGNAELPDYCYDLLGDGLHCYIGHPSSGLVVVDVSDKAHPSVLCTALAGYRIYGIEKMDEYLFLAAGGHGVVVIDMSNPKEPRKIVEHATPDHAEDLVLMGNIIVVADQKDVAVIDISRLPEMETVCTFSTQPYARHVAVQGMLAYISTGELIEVFDISEPSDPVFVGRVCGLSGRIAAAGDAAYVAAGKKGLVVLEVRRQE